MIRYVVISHRLNAFILFSHSKESPRRKFNFYIEKMDVSFNNQICVCSCGNGKFEISYRRTPLSSKIAGRAEGKTFIINLYLPSGGLQEIVERQKREKGYFGGKLVLNWDSTLEEP